MMYPNTSQGREDAEAKAQSDANRYRSPRSVVYHSYTDTSCGNGYSITHFDTARDRARRFPAVVTIVAEYWPEDRD